MILVYVKPINNNWICRCAKFVAGEVILEKNHLPAFFLGDIETLYYLLKHLRIHPSLLCVVVGGSPQNFWVFVSHVLNNLRRSSYQFKNLIFEANGQYRHFKHELEEQTAQFSQNLKLTRQFDVNIPTLLHRSNCYLFNNFSIFKLRHLLFE